ncbi:unnamed protein product [Allacma fusca]|uniref:Uncharacterized protein n=1 Tax=Allacma fusca TaxID=39272 RepID=A0A8J2K9L6_9HEXA|nr:unnamed protein product [Allacma fusca]
MGPKKQAKGKPASKGKPGKGKKDDKKGKKGEKKKSKKQLKLEKKYGGIMVDGTYILSMRRDELQFAAEKLKEQVTLQRSERIRYQLERDFLYDLTQLYLARHRELTSQIEAQTAQNNRLMQDTEEMAIVKGQEAKHFRYEVELRKARMDMSDELRRKNLNSHADRIWQNACVSIDEQLDLQDQREIEFLKKLDETKEELNDLDSHMAEMKSDMEKFSKDCVKKVQQALKDCEMITKTDSLEGEEIMNEMLFSSCKLNDDMFVMIQDYYNDMTMNNLNVIIMMRDRYEELFDHNKFMRSEIERYEDGAYRANKIMKKLKPSFLRSKIKHDQTARLEKGNESTLKSIEMCDQRMENLTEVYKDLLKRLASITDERSYFRTHSKELSLKVKESYSRRYHLTDVKTKMDDAIRRRNKEEQNICCAFENPDAYYRDVETYRAGLNKKDHALDRYLRKLTLSQWEIAEKALKADELN